MIPIIPWLIVHIPWFLFKYLWGYILYRLGLLQHHFIKEHWYKLFFHASSYPIEEDIEINQQNENNETIGIDIKPTLKTNDVSDELILSSILVLFLSLIGEIIIQFFNDKRMHSFGLLSIIAIITKSLFIVNIINRVAVVYGPIMIPYIQMKCSILFSNNNSFLSFIKLDANETNQSSNPSLQQVNHLNEIQELKNEIQLLRSQLQQFQEKENLINKDTVNDSYLFNSSKRELNEIEMSEIKINI